MPPAPVDRPWHPPRAVAIAVPFALSFVAQLIGLFIAVRSGQGVAAAVVALLASAALPLVTRWPAPVAVGVAIACAPAVAFVPGPPLAALPIAFGVVGAGVRTSRIWSWTAVGAFSAIALPLGVAIGPFGVIRPLGVALVLCVFVAFGEAMRARRERYREQAARAARQREADAEAERIRIARELHDVLAHSLSQISVQSGVGLHLFDTDPEQARTSLANIRATSGQALEEVRAVLGFLRSDADALRSPLPDLSRLPDLVEQFRESGLQVVLDQRLPDDLPAGAQLAMYRIVQESLTNIARHAHATRATVRLAEEDDGITVTIDDDGVGAGEAPEGRGLTGIRERAQQLGGTFETHSGAEGGFTVRVHLTRPRLEGAA